MIYYEVALLKSSAPILTYSSLEKFSIGDIVKVPLKSQIKEAVILKEVSKPEFKTQSIIEPTNYFFSNNMLYFAKFIKDYYFSSFSEAISLFLPFEKNLSQNSFIKEEISLPNLTSLQQKALSEIEKKDLSLFFGVTGSGKTEVYIHLINSTLKKNKDVILLMPEIALTPQITNRIKKYFKDLVVTWHSKLSKKEKASTLQKIRSKEAKVVIGARSALFLPFSDIGLIIVDEEHDDSYKALARPRYNAKDLSIYFGKKLGAKVVLGSATPLVSDYYKFDKVFLKKPYKEAKKEFRFIRGERFNSYILEEIKKVINQGEQALIFVPTRANFKYLICQNCGKAQLCPFCSIGMSIHAKKRVLKCHYCNFAKKIPKACEFCGSEDLISKREGTAEIIELIKEEIKDAKIEQFDKDVITTINKLAKALERINKKESNIIVGTQMLSKGHDYPEITLSVILGLDFIVAIGDYRAKERAIALMHQIAGRSGRAKDALILIQTSQEEFYKPYLKDYEIFIKEELNFRKMALYPPFAHLARVLIAVKDYKKGEIKLKSALELLKKIKSIKIVGSGLAPIEKIANKWRFFILVRAQNKIELLKAMHLVQALEVEIDIDPVDFS